MDAYPQPPEGVTFLVFDGTCDFCTAIASGLRWLDRRRQLYIAPFQWEWVLEQTGLTVAECEQAAWAVTPDGARHRGADAINVALDGLIGWGQVCSKMYNLPLIRRVQDVCYQWIATHRSRFPGVTPAISGECPWKPQRE